MSCWLCSVVVITFGSDNSIRFPNNPGSTPGMTLPTLFAIFDWSNKWYLSILKLGVNSPSLLHNNFRFELQGHQLPLFHSVANCYIGLYSYLEFADFLEIFVFLMIWGSIVMALEVLVGSPVTSARTKFYP